MVRRKCKACGKVGGNVDMEHYCDRCRPPLDPEKAMKKAWQHFRHKFDLQDEIMKINNKIWRLKCERLKLQRQVKDHEKQARVIAGYKPLEELDERDNDE